MANKEDDYGTQIDDLVAEIDYRLSTISLGIIDENRKILHKTFEVLQNQLKKSIEEKREKLRQLELYHIRFYECKNLERDRTASMIKLLDDIKDSQDTNKQQQEDSGVDSTDNTSINTQGLDKAIDSLKKLLNENKKFQDFELIGSESGEGFKNVEQSFKKHEVSGIDPNKALMILEQAREVIGKLLGTETHKEK